MDRGWDRWSLIVSSDIWGWGQGVEQKQKSSIPLEILSLLLGCTGRKLALLWADLPIVSDSNQNPQEMLNLPMPNIPRKCKIRTDYQDICKPEESDDIIWSSNTWTEAFAAWKMLGWSRLISNHNLLHCRLFPMENKIAEILGTGKFAKLEVRLWI